MGDGLFVLYNFGSKVVWWLLFDFPEVNLAPDTICFILNNKVARILDSACSEEGPTELVRRISSLNLWAVFEFEFPFSFVSNGQRIQSGVNFYIIISTEPVAFSRANNEKEADWWMMWNLLHVDLGPIRQECLQSLSQDWVQLNKIKHYWLEEHV